jgi:hypothetical protein
MSWHRIPLRLVLLTLCYFCIVGSFFARDVQDRPEPHPLPSAELKNLAPAF